MMWSGVIVVATAGVFLRGEGIHLLIQSLPTPYESGELGLVMVGR